MSFANPDYGLLVPKVGPPRGRRVRVLRSLVRTIGKGIRNDEATKRRPFYPNQLSATAIEPKKAASKTAPNMNTCSGI